MRDPVRVVEPLRNPPDTTVRVPGSKSITNRALLLAALAEGESRLTGALFSDDTRYMASALNDLGVAVEADEDAREIRVAGSGGQWPKDAGDLFVGNAGTAMRFLVAALCLGQGSYRIDGTERMRQRPIQDLVDALRGLGADIECELANGAPPVICRARGLAGGTVVVDASRSSQFLSAVLQVSPYSDRDVSIEVAGELISEPYVDMTIGVMKAFGVEVRRVEKAWLIETGKSYRGTDYAIEPDASAAHYFWAAAALTGGRLRVDGLDRRSIQGDVAFVDLLSAMGAEVDDGPGYVEVTGRGKLKGIDVDMNAISDTAPTLAVMGAFCSEPVRIRNVEHMRWQESDRLSAVATELARLGVRVDEERDGLTVYPTAPHGGTIETYDDHRIAMSFALAGLMTQGISISNPNCVSKTFPDYFERLEELRR